MNRAMSMAYASLTGASVKIVVFKKLEFSLTPGL
jgi:adenylate kinase